MPRILIIGGVAGGASAAAKARRVDESAEIVMLERGPHVSYANCGLPYHLSGEIEKRDDLFVATPERLKARFDVDVRVNSEAREIDRARKVVRVMDLVSGAEREEAYDKLIIATGAEPIIPPIPGVDAHGVFPLKTIEDMDRVMTYVAEARPRSAVVVGGGFIGLEAADALCSLDLEVTVVEAADQLLAAWDPDMASAVEQHMVERMSIDVVKSDPLAEVITRNGKVSGVKLESDETIECELVIMSIGMRPRTDLAREAGLLLGRGGLIVTDEYMRTSDPDIYAVGDAVESIHRVTGEPAWLPLAGPANRQGRAAGTNAAGGEEFFPGVIGTAIVRVGKIAAARTGLNQREATEAGLEHFSALTHGKSHAGYFPGAKDIALKYIVEKKTGRLLGAQAVGEDGVDKRIDVLATAIIAKMNVREVVDLELAYSPPFGSAKDPINMTAMVAQNILDGISDVVTWDEVYREEPPPLVLDVRSEDERKTVYVQGTKLVPIDELRERIGELDPDTPVRTSCRIGQRGYFAEQMLRAKGFKDVKNIAGGWRSMWGDLRDDKLVGEEPEE